MPNRSCRVLLLYLWKVANGEKGSPESGEIMLSEGQGQVGDCQFPIVDGNFARSAQVRPQSQQLTIIYSRQSALFLMPEMPYAGEDHGQAQAVGGRDHFGVAN